MLERLTAVPADAIFGLNEAFRCDPQPDKINLGIGVYRDETGQTPILETVKRAEHVLWERETSKSYLPIEGDRHFASHVAELFLGSDHSLIAAGRLATVHTPGGTGAIRIAADWLKQLRPDARVWLPGPTWINHRQIFAAAGLAVETYPYLDASRRALAFEDLRATLGSLGSEDVVVLHGCCHNPSGVDPSPEQWRQLAELLGQRQVLPLVDCAYHGFGRGLEEDSAGLRQLCEQLPELLICYSFSKTFALYNERVGALTVVAGKSDIVPAVLSQLKRSIRASYSNPPAHGAAIVTTILDDLELAELWRRELAVMRNRITEMRQRFVAGLDKRGIALSPAGNQFFLSHLGMFSFSGLTPEQVSRLRQEHSIYALESGRISFAAMTPHNLDRLCDAIARVV